MECHSPSEIEQLLGNKAINDFLRSQFQSESFNQRYRPLNDIQLIKVRNAFLKSGLYMKEFCWRLLEIFDAQKHLAENPSNLRISWNWPECEEYLEEFNEVKLELLKF
jgi:hypothetical protein